MRFIRANESDIKREAEEAATGVRVMTVHGAKGLEADVVFLADTGGAAVVPQPAQAARRRSARTATIRPSCGGAVAAEAPGAQRDADAQRRSRDGERISAPALCRDDARARRALRRRRQASEAAAAIAGTRIVADALLPKRCRARRRRRARGAVQMAAAGARAARADGRGSRAPRRRIRSFPPG